MVDGHTTTNRTLLLLLWMQGLRGLARLNYLWLLRASWLVGLVGCSLALLGLVGRRIRRLSMVWSSVGGLDLVGLSAARFLLVRDPCSGLWGSGSWLSLTWRYLGLIGSTLSLPGAHLRLITGPLGLAW